MSEVVSISVEPRDRAGKGAARATRRAGKVPGVIYGAKQEPNLIALDPRVLIAEMNKPGFMTRLFEVSIDGGKGKKPQRVLCRDVQLDPVTDLPLHVDFLRVSKEMVITVDVPVHFENDEQSPGLKRGGVLNVVRHTVELDCPAESIPESISVDLTGLEIGDSVHISHVTLPKGVQPTIERDFTIATIAAPSGVKAAAAEEAEAEEAEEEE